MNTQLLIKIINDYNFYLKTIQKGLEEPFNISMEDLLHQVSNLNGRNHTTNQFYIGISNHPIQFFYEYNTDRYLEYQGKMNNDKYLLLVHPNYLEDFILWKKIFYSYTNTIKGELIPFKDFIRITFPIRLIDKRYYWVQCEITPVQFDNKNDMVSHLNTYTILHKYNPRQSHPLLVDFWKNNYADEKFTKELHKHRFTKKPFYLSKEERKIMDVLLNDPKTTNENIAKYLNKTKNNIDMQIKNLLSKARKNFTTEKFKTKNDIAEFLNKLGYFDDSNTLCDF
jgi:hypothetical protein